MSRPGILDLMRERPVVGDGSAVITLEKRGYCMPGAYTPEAVLEYPEAIKQLHREYVRAGSDVIQTMTFYSTSGKLEIAESSRNYDSETLNQAACDLALEVARDNNTLICGGISPTPTYDKTHDKKLVQKEFQKQIDILVKNDVDFLLGEFFASCEEAEWAIEVMKSTGKPVGCTLRSGLMGDHVGVPIGECAVRLAKAGADIVGINCLYDPTTSLKIMHIMKRALSEAGLTPFLAMQPYGYHCPDVENDINGGLSLPENPFAMEPRQLTRFDVHKFAREAYELGVRYLGGCCGFEPHHIRAISEELAAEIGHRPPCQDKSDPWGAGLANSVFAGSRKKSNKEYWMSIKPSCGRNCSACNGYSNGH